MSSTASNSSNTSASISRTSQIDEENDSLWNYVTQLFRRGECGSRNAKWVCNYCNKEFQGSYYRVKSHLLQIKNMGIRVCNVVNDKVDVLVEMRRLEKEAANQKIMGKQKTVPLPPSFFQKSSTEFRGFRMEGFKPTQPSKRRAIRNSPLEIVYNVGHQDHLNALIARMFYSAGLPFHSARNPYFVMAFQYAATHSIPGYVPHGYNSLRTTLLQKEREYIERLLKPNKTSWKNNGLSIVTDGWTDSQRRSLINFIAAPEGTAMFMKAVNCEGEIKDRDFIAKLIIEVIDEKYHPSRVLTLVYQPFALGTIAILACHESKINTRKRLLFGYSLFFASSLLVLILDIATSGKGGILTFIGICAISGAFGVADAHVQGGMMGDLSFMQPVFIQSFLAGLAASGALTSALRLITKAAFDSSVAGLRKGAMLFFAISALFELLCLLLYAFVFPKLPIVKYYRSKAALEGSKTVSADLAAGGIQAVLRQAEENKKQERLSNKELILQNVDFASAIFLIYVLTLSIFPGFLSEDTGSHSLGSWYALVLIGLYNVWDLIGRYLPLFELFRLESRRGILVAVICRFLLVPAFYFTASYGGDQGWMMMLTSILGLTNGHLTVCVLTCAPRGYKGPEQNALGNLLVLFLLGGIFAGVTLDWLWLIGKGW